MTEAAGEGFAGHDRRSRRARRSSPRCARRAAIARTEPYTHAVPFSHRSGERIEPLISLQWFMAHGGARARPRSPRSRRAGCGSIPRASGGATSTGSATSAPGASRASSGGATRSRSGTAARRPTSARSRPEGDGWERDPDVLDTWFSSGAVAVRDARLARRHAGAARVLPDRRALDRPRHPLPLGRAHGHARPRVHRRACRSPTSTTTRRSSPPTAGGCPSRSARGSTRST